MKDKLGIDQEKIEMYLKKLDYKRNYMNKEFLEEVANYNIELLTKESGIYSSLQIDVLTYIRSNGYYKIDKWQKEIIKACDLLKFIYFALKTTAYYFDACSTCDSINNDILHNVLLSMKGIALIEEEIFDFFTVVEIIADCKDKSIKYSGGYEFKNNEEVLNETKELIAAIDLDLEDFKKQIFNVRIEKLKEGFSRIFKKNR